MQIPPSFIGTVMGYATFGLADLTWDPLKLSGQVGTGNLNVDYGNPFVNASIARVGPNAGAQAKLQANYTPTGDTHGAKIVSIHTDKDGLVLIENEKEYADLAAPGLFTTAVVVEATPTHCGFTPAETIASWESLRGWLAGGPCMVIQPAFTLGFESCQFAFAGDEACPSLLTPVIARQKNR